MPNGNTDLEKAAKVADATSEKLKKAFRRYGSGNPRAPIPTAYRVANRAIARAVADGDLFAVRDALATLRVAVLAETQTAIAGGAQLGIDSATRQLEAHGVDAGPQSFEDEQQAAQVAAVAAVMAKFDSQAELATSLATTGANAETITGGDDRAGVLVPSAIVAAGAVWIARQEELAAAARAERAAIQHRIDFQKVAFAALDLRTTETCINVHGQVRDQDDTYTLTGTPRWADEMLYPPFHNHCRTVSMLKRRESDDSELLAQMREDARRTAAAQEDEA
jgi:hypothetical protein